MPLLPPTHIILTALLLFITTLILLTLRLLSLLPPHRTKPLPRSPRTVPAHLLIVLGSGGHTAEMLSILRNLDRTVYSRRTYVVSSGDGFSAEAARRFEGGLVGKRDISGGDAGAASRYEIITVPRARRVHQSFLTTPVSALKSLWSCLVLLARGGAGASMDTAEHTSFPDLILTNGPGTGVIVVLASLILRFFNIRGANTQGKMRCIYIESWARVKRLSLSGKLLLRIVDRFLVQWESLEGAGGRAEYVGVLIA